MLANKLASYRLHANLLKLRHPCLSLASFGTTSSDAKVVITNHTKEFAEFKLNSPKTLNSLDMDMIDIMLGELKKWKGSTAPEAMVISGVGGKAFCAGGDIVQLYKARDQPEPSVKYEFF